MHPIVKGILAVVGGIIVGSVVNMGLVMIGPNIIPPPEGVDMTTMEGLKAAMEQFEPRHFLFPWLAHALGTLAGAFVAAKFAPRYPRRYAMGIGFWFLLGGIANSMMLPEPAWYTVVDWVGAYLPMGWLGGRLAGSKAR